MHNPRGRCVVGPDSQFSPRIRISAACEARSSPASPTSGKVVPATADWLHEIKYDGYRITRNGHDGTAVSHGLQRKAQVFGVF